jgi:replicative DNA helicase
MTDARDPTLPKRVATDLDAEWTLIKAIIERPRLAARVIPIVRSQDFSDLVCSQIWRVVERLKEARRPIGLDEIVRELNPAEILGPDGCSEDMSVADCVRSVLEDASGTFEEARWCALRIRARSLAQSLIDVLRRCSEAALGGRSREAQDLANEACALASEFRRVDVQASRELRRLRRELLGASPSRVHKS